MRAGQPVGADRSGARPRRRHAGATHRRDPALAGPLRPRRRDADAPAERRPRHRPWGGLVAGAHHRERGRAAIGPLAAELGWSHRRLISRYRDAVGLPPKTVARIVRFERAAERLRGGAELSAAAAECGYFDQAHLCREVRDLAGVTPAELRVNSVQDPAS
ncbi:helix-turn-helix domain-containing protein [Mycobacterium rufum]|uniref:Helix-turn-helix domain-containing protein n=1 Tax=Mycolicibacterium rufum TaxID=318424 RepID=A0A9X2XXA1_9MYCO|nr:helix-turn-helix domain-containing protein [Mycolicibacterium rufum]